MGKFIIEPHFRLQEWVAEEKGYFKRRRPRLRLPASSCSRPTARSTTRATRSAPIRSFEEGRKSDVSCACHWTVNVAASSGHGKLYADVYSVAPSGIFVPADSAVKTPEDLAGVPISVGYQSGSHYSTIQALEAYHAGRQDQPVVQRRHAVQAAWSFCSTARLPACGAVQRAVLFRRAARLPQDHRHHVHDRHDDQRRSGPGRPAQISSRALKRAQRDIDLRPELYTHYYKNEFPVRYHAVMDTRRWGPGERIVFEPYTEEDVRGCAFDWIADARHLRRRRSRQEASWCDGSDVSFIPHPEAGEGPSSGARPSIAPHPISFASSIPSPAGGMEGVQRALGGA